MPALKMAKENGTRFSAGNLHQCGFAFQTNAGNNKDFLPLGHHVGGLSTVAFMNAMTSQDLRTFLKPYQQSQGGYLSWQRHDYA